MTERTPVIILSMQKAARRIVHFDMVMPRPKPAGFFDPMPTVAATFDDGTRKELFTFYPDEIQFGEGELVGLTESEALDLRREKDVAYLRS